MKSFSDETIKSLKAKPGTPDYRRLVSYADNPQDYVGHMFFLESIEGNSPEPFTMDKCFYFNDNGRWYTFITARTST
jgi:hypothetical protein